MAGFILRRGALALLVLLTVSLLSFALLKLSGDLAIALAGEQAGAEYVAFLRKQYGLDDPLIVQYLRWLGRLLSGDLGVSFYFGTPVTAVLAEKFPITMSLGVSALLFAVVLSIPLGIVAALKPDSWIDRAVLGVALLGQAIPTFWLCFLMILLFGINLGWLPISGSTTWAHYVMPAVALGYYATPAFTRITRAGMIEALGSDYVRTARAKGLRRPVVILKHALRNALVPVVSVAAVQFGFMLGGSVVIETIFAMHGVGYLAWQAISQNDYPVVQAIVLIVASIYVVLTLAADLLNAAIDPRIRIR
ncbi:MAG: ABC transporter permease [Betaproteobacteria bacterium]|nr:MAG: ABC transporter permease [Betaproteobacteria bacterium]